MDKTEIDLKLNFLDTSLARNLAWVSAADSKVPAIFGIDMAMLGVLCVLCPNGDSWRVPQAIFGAIAGIGLVTSVFFLGMVTFPRLKGPKGSIVFFGGIIQHSEEAFLKKTLNGPSDEIFEDLAHQIYRNAEIANEKYVNVKRAMLLMFWSSPFWMVAVMLLYTWR